MDICDPLGSSYAPVTVTSAVSRASPIFCLQTSTMEVSGADELMKRAEWMILREKFLADACGPNNTLWPFDDRTTEDVKALVPNEEIMPKKMERRVSKEVYRIEEDAPISLSRVLSF